MLVWRLSRPEWATRLDGKGNVQRGARWNSPGRGVVYTSVNLSLSVLEALAQLAPPMRQRLPTMIAVKLELPDDLLHERVDRELLSGLPRQEIATRCRQLGDTWLSAGQALALEVPSVIVPQESNVLINPVHPLMERVQIVITEEFHFDPRLVSTEA